MLKVYEYKGCSTCRKALKYLDEKKVDYKKIAIRETAPTIAELKKMITFYGGDIRKLFNTSGQDYRALKMGDKLKEYLALQKASLTEKAKAKELTQMKDALLKQLSENGNLVKRPFVLGKQKEDPIGLVGFKEELWNNHFK